MLTLVAVLMFAGALLAAAYAVYSTVVPALPKIHAALSGQGAASVLQPLPPRRAVTTIRVTTPASAAQPTYWRAAA